MRKKRGREMGNVQKREDGGLSWCADAIFNIESVGFAGDKGRDLVWTGRIECCGILL